MSEVERTRLKTNLHNLLSLSKLLPPNCQLNSGEVQWSDEIPTEGSKNGDIYKGRYLHSEDVKIKVIRSVNMKDEEIVKVCLPGIDVKPCPRLIYAQRVRREVDLWAKIYEIDQGEHIIPFYGFYSPNGLSLWVLLTTTSLCRAEYHGSALVSPWIANGDVLEHAKKYDELFNYKKFVRTCSFAQFRRNIDWAVIDPRHCSRDQSPPLYGSSCYPWQLKSSAYTLFLTLIALMSLQEKGAHWKQW